MSKVKDWIVFYLCDWQELIAITADEATANEIAHTRELLAYENDVSVDNIKIKKESRTEMTEVQK